MNTDIRIAVGVTNHPKTIKLMRRCGDRAFFCLVSLWTWAAINRPDGVLDGLDDEGIEIAAGWNGECGVFVNHLVDVGFVDGENGHYRLHDWLDHNPWACGAEDRSSAGRLNRLASMFPEQVKELKNNGIKGVTKAEYDSYSAQWSLKRGSSKAQVALKPPSSQPLTPAPAPAPALTPNVKDRTTFCAEVCDQSAHDDVVMTIPLNVKGSEFPITEADIAQWQETFPAVDVLAELREVRQWSLDYPQKRKTRKGIRGHISRWLGKEQDRARASPPGRSAAGEGIRAHGVKDALILQRDQIARALNDDERRRQQQRTGADPGQASGVLLEHPPS